MKHFTPTLPTSDTSKNVRQFVKTNIDVFWDIWKPLVPFVIVLNLLDMVVTALYFHDSDKEFGVGGFIGSYFTMALVITWHRVVLHGPDHYVPVNPWKPKKHELAFMLMPLVLMLGYFAVAGSIIGVSIYAKANALAGILVFIFIAVAMYGSLKILFYFPAKAINADITFKQSWHMTKGYIWKLTAAGFRASIRLFLIFIVYMLALVFIGGIIGSFLFPDANLPFYLFMYVGYLPSIVYFEPVLAIIGVTVLSNYYQWAINNPRPEDRR